MPICLEQSTGLQVSATQPTDISQCSLIVLSGSEYSQINLIALQASNPYSYDHGAQLYGFTLTFTLVLYVTIRQLTSFLKFLDHLK